MSLTVAYCTAREKPQIRWFFESLLRQAQEVGQTELYIIVIDLFANQRKWGMDGRVTHVTPKPNPWQGEHRITDRDWWAVANARNTALCYCRTPWIAFVDDRSVLGAEWLVGVREAMKGNYAACGPYEKVHNLKVEHGRVAAFDETDGKDNRLKYVRQHYLQHKRLHNPYPAPGEWWYGCSNILPLEWALDINGWDEHCDGLSGEDYIFGTMLRNRGKDLRYDTRMMLIEDRTPDQCGPVIARTDKGKSPKDKSHWLLDLLKGRKEAQHPWNIRQMRERVLAGKGFPDTLWPQVDPYDGEPLQLMKPK